MPKNVQTDAKVAVLEVLREVEFIPVGKCVDGKQMFQCPICFCIIPEHNQDCKMLNAIRFMEREVKGDDNEQ